MAHKLKKARGRTPADNRYFIKNGNTPTKRSGYNKANRKHQLNADGQQALLNQHMHTENWVGNLANTHTNSHVPKSDKNPKSVQIRHTVASMPKDVTEARKKSKQAIKKARKAKRQQQGKE